MQPALAAGLGFVVVSFALNSVVTRYVVAGGWLDPGLTTAVRFVAGALSLVLVLATSRGSSPRTPRPGRANVLPAFWLGAYAVLISYGYAHIGAAAGTFVFYALVLATMTAFAALREGERPSVRSWAGSAVALAGVGILALGDVEDATVLGVLMLAGTGISWGAYSLLGRRQTDPLSFTADNFALLLLAMVPLGLVAWWHVGEATLRGLALAAAMGAVTTALSYAVWYWALARIDRVQAATYQLLIPVLAAGMGILLLDEALGPALIAAGVFVMAGMALVTPRRRPAAPDPGVS